MLGSGSRALLSLFESLPTETLLKRTYPCKPQYREFGCLLAAFDMSRNGTVARACCSTLTMPSHLGRLHALACQSFTFTALQPLRKSISMHTESKNEDNACWPPKPVHWIEKAVPCSLLPYVHLARLHKPAGTWLVAWPAIWSVALASGPGQLPDVSMLAVMAVGAVVERTRYRPLACGALPLRSGAVFAAVQGAGALALLFQLNTYTIALGLASVPLIVLYPYMKRITNLPQLFLGLTINWGALMGWAAVHASCDWHIVVPLHASCVCWTMLYDTIYAHMDVQDDVSAGIGSSVQLFGPGNKSALYGLAIGMGMLQALSGVALGAGPALYLGAAGLAGCACWQVYKVDLDKPEACLNAFTSSANLGWIPFSAFAVDRLLSIA